MVLMETPPNGISSKTEVIDYYVEILERVLGRWVRFFNLKKINSLCVLVNASIIGGVCATTSVLIYVPELKFWEWIKFFHFLKFFDMALNLFVLIYVTIGILRNFWSQNKLEFFLYAF